MAKERESALIMHDLIPTCWSRQVSEAGGARGQGDPAVNALMFRMLDAVITIGRDTERLLSRYRGVTPGKTRFIPNWATSEARRATDRPPTIRIGAHTGALCRGAFRQSRLYP